MPRERVTMRKIREILRLAWSCNQSQRETAKACGVGKTTVNDTIAPFDPDNTSEETRQVYNPQFSNAPTLEELESCWLDGREALVQDHIE